MRMQNSSTFSITLPQVQPPRDTYFCIRLSQSEKAVVHALARRLNLPASTLARHILLQAVNQFSTGEEVTIED